PRRRPPRPGGAPPPPPPIVLDCIGYTERMRRAAAEAAGRPVLLARSLAIRLAAEAVAAST
ncbi:AroM family protein, partial [Streptomyces harbinensis]|uniref:AroM family protein n=1 Tax=Streptomyces harbinensis TaxID=1176198 RepID=UPI0034DE41BD